MTDVVLWHIEISHYNEKVRWALDHKRVAHRRRAPMPGVLHPLVALAKTRRPTLPVLELDGRAIRDSTRIIAALERRFPRPPLYPADPAERRRALDLEEFFDEELAPHVRRLAFQELGGDAELSSRALRQLWTLPVPGPAAALFARATSRRYGGGAARMDLARERIAAGCERILAEAGPSGHLVGDSFTVADLTAAAVLFVLARPPEYQYELPALPPSLDEFVATLPPGAIDWVRRTWREHRPPSAEI